VNRSKFLDRVIVFTVLAVFSLFGGVARAAGPSMATAAKKDDTFQTAAPNAILIEAESGSVLLAPASLAKLMTAEVVFNQIVEGNLTLDQEFPISEYAWRHGGAPSGGSTMFAPIHSKVRVEDLLQGVIVQSANDGCIALAEGIAGSEDGFARMMNARAHEIGLTKSNFTNPTGLPDPNMRVTTRELAILARHIIFTYPQFYHWYSQREFTWNKIRQLNRNPLLTMNIGADGLKTGFTNEAGYGLVGSALRDNLRLIVVVNGLKTAKERADEARKLLEWGFHGFETRILFAEGQNVTTAKVFGGSKGEVALIGDKPVRLMVPRNTSEKIVARLVYTGPVMAPVKKGQPIGQLRVFRGENLALEVPLKAAEAVDRGTMTQRALDAVTELVGGLFRAGIKRL
jgi:D-alanyl-D-alanine carboxypeptidase (penicillin-binding protein 5/6)